MEKLFCRFKKNKELERDRIETECWRQVEASDPVSGETIEQIEERHERERHYLREQQEVRVQRQQKQKDVQRYIQLYTLTERYVLFRWKALGSILTPDCV